MKKILSVLVLVFLAGSIYGQSSEPSIFATGIEGCYSNYYITFHDRGAMVVPDGEHEVVMSVINQGRSECFMAKAVVENGVIVAPISVQKENGTYVRAERMFKSIDPDWLEEQDPETINAITDGMSALVKTQEGYWIRLFFHTFIHPNNGGNKKAPPASELLKSGE
ncbi:hypothetical protein [Algoriphagus sediminis]|uniref:Uncharacterized protein n=1 Tax=Algoriphagus sediminis TaxID=3057113 RepID=A0ABT7YEU3_9BACT|nr:hypothetical protein [Algoriphagus sediminis]MDN3205042.1 hypothetical protein [Algoriphagus sediminis]